MVPGSTKALIKNIICESCCYWACPSFLYALVRVKLLHQKTRKGTALPQLQPGITGMLARSKPGGTCGKVLPVSKSLIRNCPFSSSLVCPGCRGPKCRSAGVSNTCNGRPIELKALERAWLENHYLSLSQPSNEQSGKVWNICFHQAKQLEGSKNFRPLSPSPQRLTFEPLCPVLQS